MGFIFPLTWNAALAHGRGSQDVQAILPTGAVEKLLRARMDDTHSQAFYHFQTPLPNSKLCFFQNLGVLLRPKNCNVKKVAKTCLMPRSKPLFW